MRCRVAVLITVLFSCAVAPDTSTQAQTANDNTHSFVRDPDRPFVYLKFDHLGTGVRRSENEPPARIWLRFVNNCNTAIQLHTYRAPQGSLSDELGVTDNVVLNPSMHSGPKQRSCGPI